MKPDEAMKPTMYSKKIKEFSYRGYNCFIRELGYINLGKFEDLFSTKKWFCGYVVANIDWDQAEEVDCHGGISLNEHNLLGFDCSHAGDSWQRQNEAYCEKECKHIVDQLIEMNVPPYIGVDTFVFENDKKEVW